MFKGLKSKLEDQGKKLQASVAQYGEQLSEQIGSMRSATSDAGSDTGGNITRRFLNAVGGTNTTHPSLEDSLNHSVGNALMEEVTEGDLLGLDLPRRERRWSGGSNHSNDSSFSNFFQSVPGMTATTLDDIESDRESTVDEHGSAIVKSASKEQISTVLSKLQGRAANYKDKYRDLVKKYNEVVTENNKCRTVLEHNQDRAMERFQKLKQENKSLSDQLKEIQSREPESSEKVQKYETMLQKCKVRIKDLQSENELLRQGKENAEGETGMSDLAAERITAEWKQKIDKIEGDWTERMNTVESNYIDQVAAAKKETHMVMENKDKEIELLRNRCHELEFQDGQANERWSKKVDELQSIIQALETEKTDMVEKLSAAKTQGVQAVRDEEAVKREALVAEWKEKEAGLAAEADERIERLEKEHKEMISKLKEELATVKAEQVEGESQAGLLKAAEHGLEIQLSELQEKLKEAEAEAQKQKDLVDEVVESVTTRHKTEIAELIKEHEELLSLSKMQADVERVNLNDTVTTLHAEVEQLKKRAEMAQKELEEERTAKAEEVHQQQKSLHEEIEKYKSQLAELSEKSKRQLEELKASHSKESTSLRTELEQIRQELEERGQEADVLSNQAEASKKESEEHVSEMRVAMEEKNERIHRLEKEKEELESELAQSRELSGIHEHLRVEVEEARKQKQETEVKLLVAEKTIQELQEAVAKTEVRPNGESEVEELITFDSAPVLESSNDKVQEISSRLNEVERKNSELEQRLATLTAEKDALTEQLSTISSREGDLSAKHQEELSAMRDTWETLETEKSQLATRLDALRAETSSIIEDLKKRADEAEAAKEELTRQLETAKEELVKSEAKKESILEDEKEESKKAAVEVERLQEQVRDLEKKVKESNDGAEIFKTERVGLISKIEELNAEISSLNENLEKAAAQVKEVSVEKIKLSEELDKMSNKKNSHETTLASLQEQLDQLRSENEELTSRVEESSKLVEAIEEEKSRVDELEKKYKEKEAEFEGKLVQEAAKNEELMKEMVTMKTSIEGAESEKEKIIAELREKLDTSRDQAGEAEKTADAKMKELEGKIREAVEEVEKSAETVERLTSALEDAKKANSEAEKEWERKKTEEAKIREQYSLALENSKSEMVELTEKVKSLSILEADITQLKKQQEQEKATYEQKIEQLIKEKDLVASEWEQKMNKAVEKQKKLGDDELTKATAELLLQTEELRSAAAATERKMDDVVLEKARLEQEVIALSGVREDLEQRKAKEKAATTKLAETERRVMDLEADNKVIGERKTELEEERNSLVTKLEENRKTVADQEQQIKTLQDNNEEAIRKAAAKQDSDGKKVIRELQREVKQLYVELNEKSEAVDSLKKQLEELKATSSEPAAVAVKAQSTESAKDYMYEEELESMRRKLKESHREIDELRDLNGRLERSLEGARKTQNTAAPKTNGSASLDHHGFADPAEAEYLKNVLFRYMAERESLGKECVTLARVIGTVAKFNKSQLDAVLAREEHRLNAWVPGAVSNVLGGRP